MSDHLIIASPARPILKKTNAFEIGDLSNKKLTRGISRATDNVNLVSRARNEFAMDFKDSGHNTQMQYFVETPVFTFTLPDLTIYSDEFQNFLEKDLIETSTLISLEQAGRLNWWVERGAGQRLWPLATTGDGNCLLHAASLGMWGFHDRLLTLRKALHATLTNGAYKSAIWRRWRWQQTLVNDEAGLLYCEDEWNQEWENLLHLSSTEPRSRPERKSSCHDSPTIKGLLDTVSEMDDGHDVYESLEEIHILALAHVLRRPIIVVADTMLKDVTGEPFAPIPFGGIYLPLECPAKDCHKSPLVLTYDAAHFSALVAMEKESYADKTPQLPAIIPLIDPDLQLLPVQFAVDPGENFRWGIDEFDLDLVMHLRLNNQEKVNLLQDYLDIVQITAPTDSNKHVDNKKLNGGNYESEDNSPHGGDSFLPVSKNKATKQLQFVAKQFGSIGRTMSKKLKKNLGTLTRIGRSNSFKETHSNKSKDGLIQTSSPVLYHHQDHMKVHSKTEFWQEVNCILAAELHTEKRHEYQEEMIRNYLHTAHERFERDLRLQQVNLAEEKQKLQMNNTTDIYQGPIQCINAGCSMFGTVATSYLCSGCYMKQKQHEVQLQHQNNKVLSWNQQGSSILYGAGKSHFYAESDTAMFASIAKMHTTRRPSPCQDQTLYLSKSTFYNDVNNPSSQNALIVQERIVTSGQSPITSHITGSIECSLKVSVDNCTPPTVGETVQLNEQIQQNQTVSLPARHVSQDNSLFSKSSILQSCQTPKCQYFGSEDRDFLCSRCYKKQVNSNSNFIFQLRTTHI